jgi:selenide,water dikinase
MSTASTYNLTAHCRSGGCAAKFSPTDLRIITQNLKIPTDPNVLVSIETNDNAGVYKLTENLALVQTVDYITPPCDEPFLYGQVAAANSLSDVYAMGGKPLTAMNICCFPQEGIAKGELGKIHGGGTL